VPLYKVTSLPLADGQIKEQDICLDLDGTISH